MSSSAGAVAGDPTRPVRGEDAFDVRVVAAWLARHAAPEFAGDLDDVPEVRQFPGGASNLTYLLRYPGRDLILRRPPAGAKAKSAHDMGREFTIQSALKPVFPRVPAMVGFCEDPRVIGSDFLFWAGLHVAREQVIEVVLATPPELLATVSPQERARVNAMLDNILPVSTRAEGLRSDSSVGKHLAPSPLESVHVPTLIVSARDDGYGTYASAQYTASRIAGARFVGFDRGGHTWVGHDDEVMAEIVKLLETPVKP